MMAILQRQDDTEIKGNSREYLLLMLCKACLNVWALGFSHRSLWRSLLGIGGITLCLADTVLLCAMGESLPLGEAATQCLTMSHASTVYALLPVPFLLLGAFDFACNSTPGSRTVHPCRTLCRATLVLSIWGMAGLYSYCYTHAQVIDLRQEGQTVLACEVENSSVVIYFNMGLTLVVCSVLLFYSFTRSRQVPEVFDRPWADPLAHAQRTGPHQGVVLEGQRGEPLLLHLTMGFALTWAPFLVFILGTAFLDLAVPSYLTVNIMWVLCANSFLVGVTLWYRGDQAGPWDDLPDDMCTWSKYWHHDKRGAESSLQGKPLRGVLTLSRKSTDELQVI